MSNVAQAEQRGQRRAGRVTEPSALIDLAAPQASHEDGVLTRVALRVLRDALATLPDEERLILDLAIADLPRAQIADQLGLTATNVTTKLHRARERLRRFIGPDLLTELGLGRDGNPTGGAA
jgi:RNA polymerase sigma factor (sigma-70 family)